MKAIAPMCPRAVGVQTLRDDSQEDAQHELTPLIRGVDYDLTAYADRPIRFTNSEN